MAFPSFQTIIAAALFAVQLPAAAADLFEQVRQDYRNHYSSEQLLSRGLLLGVGGVMAHSEIDREVPRYLREEMDAPDGDTAKRINGLGDYTRLRTALPLYLGAMWLGHGGGDHSWRGALRTWGNRSLRAVLLGGPEFSFLSRATGSSRPGESASSEWRTFKDDNGVSGHAFFGALPLLTAAQMSGRRWTRYSLMLSSTLPALVRVENDQQYLSQAVLGWGLAYLTTRTVARGEPRRRGLFELEPAGFEDGGIGLQLRARW